MNYSVSNSLRIERISNKQETGDVHTSATDSKKTILLLEATSLVAKGTLQWEISAGADGAIGDATPDFVG